MCWMCNYRNIFIICRQKSFKVHALIHFFLLRHFALLVTSLSHRRLCRVKNMLAMYLKYHKNGLTPTTPVTSTAISPIKMSIGRKSLTNLRSEMIFLQGKHVFYIFLPSPPPYWQIIFRFCWQWTLHARKNENRSRETFRLSVVLGFYHCLTKDIWEVHILAPCNFNLECF